jgi:hypothetical protein
MPSSQEAKRDLNAAFTPRVDANDWHIQFIGLS